MSYVNPLIFLGAILIAHVASVAQVLDNPVRFPAKIAAGYENDSMWTDEFAFTFYGDSGSQTFSAFDNTLFDPIDVEMIPGKWYTINVPYQPDIAEYTLYGSPPKGYEFYISNISGSDLLLRSEVTHSGTVRYNDDTLRVKIESVGVAEDVMKIGTASSWVPDKLIWKVGMGSTSGDGSAGAIQIRTEEFSSSVFTPASLEYDSPSLDVVTVYSGGDLRQVNAPQGLADIVTVSSTSYRIDFYDWTDVDSWNGSTYDIVLGASPFVKYTVSKLSNTSIRVQKTVGSTSWYTRLTYDSGTTTWSCYDWTEGGSETTNYERFVKVVISGLGTSVETRLFSEYGPSLSLATQTRKTYTKYGWGYEVTKIEEGYVSSALRTTDVSYYTSLYPDGVGNYGRIKQITAPDGGQVRYVYFNSPSLYGRTRYEYSHFEDTSEGKRVEYTYTNSGTSGPFFLDDTKTYVSSTLVARENRDYSSYTRNGEPVRRTVIKRYKDSVNYDSSEVWNYRESASTAFLRGRLYAIKNVDGTQVSFAYDGSSPDKDVYTYFGTAGIPSGETYTQLTTADGEDIEDIYVIEKKSTRSATHYNAGGLVDSVSQYVNDSGSSFTRMSETVHSYEEGSLLEETLQRVYDGGGTYDSQNVRYEATYLDGQLLSAKDETGQETLYVYDKLGRVEMETLSGGASTVTPETPEIKDRYISYEYDGSSRIVTRTVAGSGTVEVIESVWDYDLAGRLTSKTLDCCDTVTYEYPTQDQVKTINADSGYVLENYYKDGSLDNVTGTATTPKYRRSRVYSDKMEIWTALESFAAGVRMDGWRVERVDWLGRTVQIEEPALDIYGTSAYRFTNFEYNSDGQLASRRVQSSSSSGDLLAPYLYVYNALGQVKLEGLDLDDDGLEEISNDRIVGSEITFYKDGSNYWWTSVKNYVYPSGASGAVLLNERRSRVAPDAGELSESLVYQGPTSASHVSEVVAVDRTKAIVTRTLSYSPGPSGDEVSIVKNGLPVKASSSGGGEVKQTYDALRRLETKTGRDNTRTVYGYVTGSDKVSNETQENSGGSDSLLVLDYTYSDGRLSQVKRTNDFGGSASYEYENYAYTTLGKLESRTGNGVYPIAYDYDDYGRLEKQFQTRGVGSESKVTWAYDDATGLLLSKSHYEGATERTESYRYNKLGLRSRRTAARGVYTDYGYSIGSSASTGDLLTESHSDSTPDVTYTYDRMSRPATVADIVGTRSFTYGAQSGLSLSSEDLPNDSYGPGNDISYAYEGSGSGLVPGRYKSFGYDGVVWSQAYEVASGRVGSVTADLGGSSEQFDYAYDTDSDHVLSVEGNYYKQERSWESWRENYAGTKISWNGTTRAQYTATGHSRQGQVYSATLVDDGSSSLLQKIKGASGSIDYSVTYDARGQLLSWDSDRTGGSTDSTYTWDEAGNPTSYAGQSYTPDSLNRIEPTGGGTDYSYDNDGNLLEDTVWTYVYDANNRLVAMGRKDNTKYLRFAYDYMGRRVEKKVYNNGTGTGTIARHLRFVYQGMELAAEIDGSSYDLLKTFHWGPDKSEARGGAGGAMGLVMWRDHDANESYYPSYDLNGNVTGLLDDGGSYVAWYEYDAFGKVLTEGGTGTMVDDNPIRFSTQYTDDESGLVYYGLRYYDPGKGRFINRDPIGEQGGANLYRFVGNDPANRIDVWGLKDLNHMIAADEAEKELYELEAFSVKAPGNVILSNEDFSASGFLLKGASSRSGASGASSNSGSSAKKEKPPAQKENEKPDWQKKLLEKLCGSEEGRKAVERLSKVTVNTADSIMANIEINGSVRSVEAGGFFRPGEGAVYLNVGGKSTESLSSKVVHEAVHVQQYLDLGIDGFRGLSRTDKEVPAYGTQEQFHIDMGWPAVNEHTRRYTGFLGMGGPAIDFNGIRSWQDSINSVGNYLAPTIEGLNMNVGGWECPEN